MWWAIHSFGTSKIPKGVDGRWFTPDDGLRLLPSSPGLSAVPIMLGDDILVLDSLEVMVPTWVPMSAVSFTLMVASFLGLKMVVLGPMPIPICILL